MKKLSILFAAVCLLFSTALVSCEKSNEALLNDYENVAKDIVQATKDGNILKMGSLAKKGADIEKEIAKRQLTAEEQQRYLELQAEIATGVAGGAVDAANDVMDKAADLNNALGGSDEEAE